METTEAESDKKEDDFPWRIQLGVFWGFPFYFHVSIFLLFLALFWVKPNDFLLFISLLIFSVTIHELSHALACRSLGFGDGTLTIWAFGGYFIPFSELSLVDMGRQQKLRYALMILAGPLSNLLLAGLFFALGYFTTMGLLYTAAMFNVSLAILNLMPVGRLDGGNILIYLGSTILHWRKTMLLAGILSLLLAGVLLVSISSNNWLVKYSNMVGLFIVMGASTIRASRRPEAELKEESRKQVLKEMAFVESSRNEKKSPLSYILLAGLAGMFAYSLYFLASTYVNFHDLPGRIVYVDRDNGLDLYITSGMGFSTKKLAWPMQYHSWKTSSSTDVRTFVFGCTPSRESDHLDFCISDQQGRPVKKIELEEEFGRVYFQLAPQGDKLAFSSDEGGFWLMDISTESKQHFPIEGSVQAWSPDGTTILLSSPVSEGADILQVSIQDGSFVNLTNDPSQDHLPAYSRDGKYIYFLSDREGSYGLYRMDADGRNLRSYNLRATMHQETGFQLSPDDTKIVFECGEFRGQVCIASLDGSQASLLANGQSPVWSPNGEYIAYATDEDAKGIMIILNDGSKSFQIKSLKSWGEVMDWLP